MDLLYCYKCTHTAENEGNSCAADWRYDLPPAYKQVDEFSQSTLGAFVRKCPAATKGVPPPRQHTEKSEARHANLPARFHNGEL